VDGVSAVRPRRVWDAVSGRLGQRCARTGWAPG